jgi:hypothetical protein
MLLATDFPFLNIMWEIFIFAVVVTIIWVVIQQTGRSSHGI